MSLLRKVLRRLGRPPRFERRLIMLLDLDDTLPSFRSQLPVETEEFRADLAQLEETLAVLPAEHRSDLAQRLARGDRCWVTRHAGAVVNVIWVGLGSTYSYDLDRRLPLERNDATFYSVFTFPELRRRGIDSAVSSLVLRVLRERGVARVVLLIDPRNAAALRVPVKLGMRIVGQTGFIELFGVRFYFHRDGGFLPHVKPRSYWRKV